MPVVLFGLYIAAWTLGLFMAVGLGHNLTARRGKRPPRREAERQFDRLMHEYQEAEAAKRKRAR